MMKNISAARGPNFLDLKNEADTLNLNKNFVFKKHQIFNKILSTKKFLTIILGVLFKNKYWKIINPWPNSEPFIVRRKFVHFEENYFM